MVDAAKVKLFGMDMGTFRWDESYNVARFEYDKNFADKGIEPSLLKSVQDSYINLLEMYRNRCEQIDGYWSDLPRELACMQMSMMDERRFRTARTFHPPARPRAGRFSPSEPLYRD